VSAVFNINGGSAGAGVGSAAATTVAGIDFVVSDSELLAPLADLPLAGLGIGFPEVSESDESSLVFGEGMRVDEFIAFCQAGWKESPLSLLCCPMRVARGSAEDDAAGIDIRTGPRSAR
jgi:hypothetical protein